MRVCPICSSGYASVVYKALSVWLCSDCGMVYSDSAPVDYVNDSAYEDLSLYGGSEDAREHYRWQAERFRGWFRIDTKILDIGSATGGMLNALRTAGYQNISGFDLSAKARENCRKMGFTMHDEIPTGQDLVVLSHVLEHAPDVHGLLRTVKYALKPGGMAYIEVPDADEYHSFKSVTSAFNPEHINHFTRKTLQLAVATARLDWIWCLHANFRYCVENYPVIGVITQKSLWPAYDSSFVKGIEERTREMISKVDSSRNVALWGLGMLTERLFGGFPGCVVAATDSNSRYHGRDMFGVKVVPPEQFKPPQEIPIAVCTQLKIDEIVSRIKELGLPNELITFPTKG